jgi:FtsP/CotA-like multicopper oxidase with cupredoxin domain
MSQRQRFTFLAIAIVIAVVAIVVLAGGSDDENEPGGTAATATATPTETAESPGEESTPTPTPTPKPPPLLTADRVTKLEATEGETVKFRVRSDEPEEVHVHGYNIAKDIEPGQTVTMSFKADINGSFEIEFEHSHTQIAELKVEPG